MPTSAHPTDIPKVWSQNSLLSWRKSWIGMPCSGYHWKVCHTSCKHLSSLAVDRSLENHQCSTEAQKLHQNLAPALVIVSWHSLVFRKFITSTGFYRCCARRVSTSNGNKLASQGSLYTLLICTARTLHLLGRHVPLVWHAFGGGQGYWEKPLKDNLWVCFEAACSLEILVTSRSWAFHFLRGSSQTCYRLATMNRLQKTIQLRDLVCCLSLLPCKVIPKTPL